MSVAREAAEQLDVAYAEGAELEVSVEALEGVGWEVSAHAES